MGRKVAQAEKWGAVLGYEGTYEVSTFGRVRSVDRVVYRRQPDGYLGPSRYKGKMLVARLNAGGYPRVNLVDNGQRRRTRCVHTLVLETFVGPRPDGLMARHISGDSTNPKLSNLCWGTHLENQADRVLHKTDPVGCRNPAAKLSAEKVREIRVSKGLQREIAERYGVAQSHVSRIKRNTTWKNI